MGKSEKSRSIVLHRVETGALTLEQATRVLSLSYRHMKRVWRRFRDEGTQGLAHRARGRPSNRAFREDFREEVLRRFRAEPPGTGPTQFAAALSRQGILVDHETLRRWLLETGAWKISRSRQAARVQEPAARGFGELLTLLCIEDRWLGPGFSPTFLLLLRDEATARMLCSLAPEDNCEEAMRLLAAWTERHGLPAALRCPRRFVLEDGADGAAIPEAGSVSLSPLARACERLGVDVAVLAAAQEKAWPAEHAAVTEAVAKELARRDPSSLEEAAAILLGAAGDSLNRRFAARVDGVPDYHVPIVDGTDLRRYLCVERTCRVQPDGVVAAGSRRVQLGSASPKSLPETVIVSEWLDGSFHVFDGGRELSFREVDAPSAPRRVAI